MKTWLNPDPNLHTDMLRQQIAIGLMLKARFQKQEEWGSHAQISIEINQVYTIIYNRNEHRNQSSNH